MNTMDLEQELIARINNLVEQAVAYHDKYGCANNDLEDQIADTKFDLRQVRQIKEILKRK